MSEEQKPPQPPGRVTVNVTTILCTLSAVISVAFGVFIGPASGAYQANHDTIKDMLAHQASSDEQFREYVRQTNARLDKVEGKVDDQAKMNAETHEFVKLQANDLKWIKDWVKAGGEKQKP